MNRAYRLMVLWHSLADTFEGREPEEDWILYLLNRLIFKAMEGKDYPDDWEKIRKVLEESKRDVYPNNP